MKVLMATDGSQQSMAALHTASRLLRRPDQEVTLLTVAPELRQIRAMAGATSRNIRIDEHCRRIALETGQILDRARKLVEAEGLRPSVLPEVGSAAEAITRIGEQYDLIVVGAHDRYAKTKPGLGPVATRVVQHASSNVLIAREMMAERSFRILVAVDASRASENAIQTMASSIDISTSEVTLMHVVETPWVGFDGEQQSRDWASDSAETELERELRLEALGVIEEARGLLEPHGVSIRTIIAEGNPATEILGEAEAGDYDLIVLGATGAADMKHQMLGSVSTKVALNAPCSVLVVKNSE